MTPSKTHLRPVPRVAVLAEGRLSPANERAVPGPCEVPTRTAVDLHAVVAGQLDLDPLVGHIYSAFVTCATPRAALDRICVRAFGHDYEPLLGACLRAPFYVLRHAANAVADLERQAWCATMPRAALACILMQGWRFGDDGVRLDHLFTLVAQLSVTEGRLTSRILARNGLSVVRGPPNRSGRRPGSDRVSMENGR